jgi:hypothetical protein
MNYRNKSATTLLVLILLQICSQAQINPLFERYSKQKKLIEFSQHIPYDEVLQNSVNMGYYNARPFDGIIFKANWPIRDASGIPEHSIFYPNTILPSAMGFDDLTKINWGSHLTDNFLWAFVGIDPIDWYSDEKWQKIIANVRLVSLQMVASKAKGLFFDTEDYSPVPTPWMYTPALAAGHTFADVSLKVRQRGKEFMEALQYYKSDVKLMGSALWMNAIWAAGGNINNLSTSRYGLLKAFSDGLLEGASGNAKIIEGNEISYVWTNTINWITYYDYVTKQYPFIDNSLLEKSKTHYQVGASTWFEGVVGIPAPTNNDIAAKKLEHNIFQSLFNSDEYAWFYSEQLQQWTVNPIPEPYNSSFINAKAKIANHQALGFTVSGGNTINISTLKITSPTLGQQFNIGDVINFQVEQPTGFNIQYINYFISYERKIEDNNTTPFSGTFTAVKPGWYHVYAYSNSWLQFSQQVDFYVKPANCGTATSRPGSNANSLEIGTSITKK